MAILSIKTQPISQTVALGGTLSLSVDATGGSGIYTFQWEKDSSNIPDATSKNYSKSSFAESNAGLYFASAYDGTTTVLSNDATVRYPLTIDTQPLSQIVALGGTLNLSVSASGGVSPYTYQWKKGTGDISGATSSTYSKSSFAETDATTYKVLVTGSDSSTVLSNGAIINYPFTIDTQPDTTTVPLGGTLNLSVGVSGGSGSYTYQWLKNATNIPSATSSSYSKGSFAKGDAGAYTVSTSDGTTALLSSTANVGYPLTIDVQPQSYNLTFGSILSLSVSVSGGSGSYSYQWKRNSVNVPGATNNTYMTILQESTAGSYTVTITDGITNVTSNAAVIGYPFTIDTQPVSQGIYTGGALNFVVTVSGGSGSYTYQWLRDGSNIFDASSNSYVISSFNALTNGGQYAVSTSDGTTTLLSNTVQAGSLTEVLGAPTNMVSGNNTPYTSSFVWELDPVTSLPVNVKVINKF